MSDAISHKSKRPNDNGEERDGRSDGIRDDQVGLAVSVDVDRRCGRMSICRVLVSEGMITTRVGCPIKFNADVFIFNLVEQSPSI